MRSNAAYGSVMVTVEPPEIVLLSTKVKFTFRDCNDVCTESLTRYNPLTPSYSKPYAFSNSSQADDGSMMYGTVEST